ncbi:YidH family protein [Sphingomonas baiyangensis]|uniref:DUF202 domain-containing protein n=1 Tax=Sphingomonas baiyangensis TaxID=2572576 RepID=A0A4U1L1X9_9SPHN|nr:DUF202 domain-containing protein [Sphingomonas baiyangensis]TKD49955.1 DUF202 domain-containing protein [Sphingomonas baiyangensis]
MAQEDDDEDRSRNGLAQDRTDLAEDRTSLANERTFSGWARTGLAAVGIGVGFHALMRELEPVWLPKSIATLFVLLGIFVVVMAERRACAINERLSSHNVQSLPPLNMRVIAIAVVIAAFAMIAGIWTLY